MRLQVTSASTEATAKAVKFFGQYLIEEGEIDEAQLAQALEILEEVNVRIDHLAVRAG